MKCYLSLPILALLLPLATSCLAPTPTPPPTPAPAVATVQRTLREPVTLVLWHTEPEGTPAASLLAELVADFHREHRWITIEPAYVGDYDDLYRKALAAVRAGHPPDLLTAQRPHIAALAKAGALAPLAPYTADPECGLTDADWLDIWPGFAQACRYPESGGQMLSVPYTMNALALYYNLSALQAAGIEAPPQTWAEFEAACRALSDEGAVGYAAAVSASTFTGWLHSRGTVLLDEADGRAAFAGPEGVEALDLMARLLAAGAARHTAGTADARALFAARRAAFTMDSTASLPAYAAEIEAAGQSFEWGCTLIPQEEPGTARTVLYGPGLCILRTDEARQQAAWRFLHWFLATEQAARWAMELGYTPPRQSAVERLAATGWLDERPLARQALEEVIPHALPEPAVRAHDRIATLVEDAWLAATAGVRTSQEALGEAASLADELLITGR